MATKRGDNRYRTTVYVGKDPITGKRKYEFFEADKPWKADALADQFKEDQIRLQKPQNMTLGEAIDKYIAAKDGVLSPKTVKEYSLYRKNNAQALMSMKISRITNDILQTELNKDSKTLAPKTVRNIYGFVISVLNTYIPNMKYKLTYPQKTKSDIRIPTEDELKLIIKAAEGTNIELPILLGACLGMRRSEISAIDLKNDIDYDNNKIKINKAMVHDKKGSWVTKAPKAYSSYRVLDIPPHIIVKLKEAKENNKHVWLKPESITGGFEKLLKRLDIKNIRFHDLRHYYASVLLSLGVPDKYAMELMGHSTPNMLKTVYQHLMESKKTEVANTVNTYYDKLLQP